MKTVLIYSQKSEAVKSWKSCSSSAKGRNCPWHYDLGIYYFSSKSVRLKSKVFLQCFTHWQRGDKSGRCCSLNLSWEAQCKGVQLVSSSEIQFGNEVGVLSVLSFTLLGFISFALRNLEKTRLFFLPNSLLLSY